MNKRNVVMYPDAGTGAGGGGAAGASGAAGAGTAGAGAAAGAGTGAAQGPFADAGAARTYLAEWHDADFVKGLGDDKVMPWATKIHGRASDLGKQFPADWRNQLAGDQADDLKTLDRFETPRALWHSTKALRAKLSSGELKPVTAFPDKGTPEEQAAWRSANGVPMSAEEYKFQFGKDVKIEDDDKPILESLQKSMHARHVPAANAQAMVDWFFAEKQARAQARAQNDEAYRESSEDTMRSEWGNDYKSNKGRISALLDTGPKGLRDLLGGARLGDGSKLGDHPEWLRFFAQVARQTIPSGVVITDGADIGKSVADEIQAIETVMKENRKKYNDDPKMQARLRELYDYRDRGGKKAA